MDSDEAMELAEQYKQDTGGTADATLISASLLYGLSIIAGAIRDGLADVSVTTSHYDPDQ